MKNQIIKIFRLFLVSIFMLGFSKPVLVSAGSNQNTTGSIWTTNTGCGVQNVNHYEVGEVVYIRYAGFTPGVYTLTILQVSGNPKMLVEGPTSLTLDESGCFAAHTVQASEAGHVFSVDLGKGHNDNYSVKENNVTPSPTPSLTATTPVPTQPTSTETEPTPSPTETTPVPTEPTPTETEPTPSPTETTPVPTEPTPTETEPTPSATETTPEPAGVDPAPQAVLIPVTGNTKPLTLAIPVTGTRIIVAGWAHTCMTIDSGQVVCWGLNESGQVGNATFEDQYRPVYVQNLDGVMNLAAGSNHTCALTIGN